MSIELILIPLGIAAYAALKEQRRTDLCEGCKQTRVTEPGLLIRTLNQLGATDVVGEGDLIRARSAHGMVRFQLVEGIFLGRVDDGSEEETQLLIDNVNTAVGRILQAEKVEEMRTRAAQLGLRLVGEEVVDDGTVQLVFEEAE